MPQPVLVSDPVDEAPVQYQRLKRRYPEAVLAFRIDGSYLFFAEDIPLVADILGCTQGLNEVFRIPASWFQETATRIAKAGRRVVVCSEELEMNSMASEPEKPYGRLPKTHRIAFWGHSSEVDMHLKADGKYHSLDDTWCVPVNDKRIRAVVLHYEPSTKKTYAR